MLIKGMPLENKTGKDFSQYHIYRITIDCNDRNTAILTAEGYGCNIWDLIQTNSNEWCLLVVLPSTSPLHRWLGDNDVDNKQAKLTAFTQVNDRNEPIAFGGFNHYNHGLYML